MTTPTEKFPRISKTELITKERMSARPEKMREDYKKSVDRGRKSGRGRVVFTLYDLCESFCGGVLQQSSVDTVIDSSSASVQDEPADSVTDEVSEQDDEEVDLEAAVSQEGSKLAEATKKRRARVAEMLNTRKDNKMNQKLASEAQFLLSSSSTVTQGR